MQDFIAKIDYLLLKFNPALPVMLSTTDLLSSS